MQDVFKKPLIFLTIFLSLYGPPLFGNIYIYQLFIMVVMVSYLPSIINNKIHKSSLFPLILFFILIISFFGYLIAFLTSGTFVLSLSSIGGFEAYMEIFFGLIFGFLLHRQGITLLSLEKFILFMLMPIANITVLSYLFFPDTTMVIINNYLYGISNTGQWRFSGFYGLPYYAAIGYLIFMFEIILAFKKKPVKITKLYLQLSFFIMFIGGMLAASKTFIIGFFILLILSIVINKSPVKYFLKFFSIFLVSLILLFNIMQNNDSQLKKIFNLLQEHSISTIYEAVLFRYSSENTAIANSLSDSNWNSFIGIGGNARSIATDSQYRDVVYRFGYTGFIFFMLFIFSIFYYLSFEYKFLLIILAIGSLGSNCFTPIGSTLIIWTLLNINILENQKVKSYQNKKYAV